MKLMMRKMQEDQNIRQLYTSQKHYSQHNTQNVFLFQSSGIQNKIYINIQISCLSFVVFKIYTFITSFFVSNITKQCIDKMVCLAYTNMNINHHNQQLPYIVQITYQGRLCFVISHMSQKNQLNIVLYDSYYAMHTI